VLRWRKQSGEGWVHKYWQVLAKVVSAWNPQIDNDNATQKLYRPNKAIGQRRGIKD
jgi:hypothetical protein